MVIKSSKKGFTLAEVLVTLVVIGIVAALSIPALLQNTNSAELKTAFKKSLAGLNQALVMSIAQDSTDAGTCCGNTTTELSNFFARKMNVISNGTNWFVTADGMQYTVISKGGTCPAIENVSGAPVDTAANCVILVDVNGAGKGPNAMSSGTGTTAVYKDRYTLVVRSNSVVPAINGTSTAAIDALQN
jgi:prepilin-type N-terminal cleavage/methylation domain-containing protein